MLTNKVKYEHGIKTRTKKTAIVIHGTGGDSVNGCIASFQKDGVSVPFIIDRDGIIYQLYDESFDHWHAGANFRGISRKSIGIELVNWNHLEIKNNKIVSWTGKEINQDDVYMTSMWRGYTCFQQVPDVQHKALKELLKYLCEKHGIKKVLLRKYNPEMVKKEDYSGICLHSSFHKDKTDFHPELLKIITL